MTLEDYVNGLEDYANGALSLPEAFTAVRDGYAEPEQAICNVCGCAPCLTPGFCSASRAADADPVVITERNRAVERLPRAVTIRVSREMKSRAMTLNWRE